MRRRLTRKKALRQKKIVITTAICLLFIMVTGYAAFQTQISINAKGNVKGMLAADYLRTLVTDSGDGLYKDEYGYIYRGTAPNNYIKFGNMIFRIISIEDDETLKVIGDSIGTYNFSETTYEESSLSVSLNGDDYYNNLDSSIKSLIVSHVFNVGMVTYQISEFDQTLLVDITQEKATTWTGNIGMVNTSDYVRSNSNTTLCGTVNQNNYTAENYSTCKSTTWLYNETTYWTINRFSCEISAWLIFSDGFLGGPIFNNQYIINSSGEESSLNCIFLDKDYDAEVRPTFYLNSNITLTGTGTESDPYIPTLKES